MFITNFYKDNSFNDSSHLSHFTLNCYLTQEPLHFTEVENFLRQLPEKKVQFYIRFEVGLTDKSPANLWSRTYDLDSCREIVYDFGLINPSVVFEVLAHDKLAKFKPLPSPIRIFEINKKN